MYSTMGGGGGGSRLSAVLRRCGAVLRCGAVRCGPDQPVPHSSSSVVHGVRRPRVRQPRAQVGASARCPRSAARPARVVHDPTTVSCPVLSCSCPCSCSRSCSCSQGGAVGGGFRIGKGGRATRCDAQPRRALVGARETAAARALKRWRGAGGLWPLSTSPAAERGVCVCTVCVCACVAFGPPAPAPLISRASGARSEAAPLPLPWLAGGGPGKPAMATTARGVIDDGDDGGGGGGTGLIDRVD